MSNRARRVLVYTAALLIAPVPLMPFEPRTREFALALVPCGIVLTLASFYVARGEIRSKGRDTLGLKLIAASVITTLFGSGILVGTLIYLLR